MPSPLLLALALAAAPAGKPPMDAPITAVTVFSDRAQVTRVARVSLNGPESLSFPLLPESVPTESIRVEARGADVQRVNLEHVEPGGFPLTEGRKMLDALDALDLQLHQVELEREAFAAQIGLLQRAVPTITSPDPSKPLPKVDPKGWTQTVTFIDAQIASLQSSARDAEEKARKLSLQRNKLAREAYLLGATQQAGGTRVIAALAGSGQAELTLTYSIPNARWYPGYDIALDPASSSVSLGFSGLVSQETGEDWTNAAITLSTAIPAQSLVYPTLTSWEIGEKARFVPTPNAVNEPIQPLPPVPPALSNEPESERVRRELLQRVATTTPLEAKPPPKTMANFQQPDKKEDEALPEAPPPPPATPAPASAPAPVAVTDQLRSVPSAAAGAMAQSEARDEEKAKISLEEVAIQGASAREVATVGVGLAPPSGWAPPSYAAELPASLARGYDLSWTSPRKETVASGKGPRRIPLFSERWPVKVERRLFPELAPEAYLVAELANPSKRVLPGGSGNLFVGSDPAGTAQLDLVAPGETFTLPLGLDRAVKPVRNLKLVENEQGIIGKDRVSHYVVTIEVANPYPTPIAVRIFDQWPLSDQEAVKITLDDAKPYALQDPRKGSLEWRLNIPPSGKTTVSYSYTIRRPKDFQLHQR